MRPAEALTAIQTMADHSQKWHDGTTSKNIRNSSNKDRLDALVNKLDNLGIDMKKLKKSVHAIQVGCQICEGPHLDKDCPLNEEVKQVEEVEDSVWSKSFICVSGKSNETLSLGRKNGARFRKMIMEEMEETLRDDGEDFVDKTIQKLRGNSRDRLDSYSFGNLAEFAAVTA
ncbi:hypothetical protein Tco_0871656 [Tanacetum coccineum]